MASSIIHLAITKCLADKIEFKDLSRLRLGSILPDGAVSGNGHLKISICGDTRFTYDLEFFRNRYGEQMKTDDLYLGYYLHLVQDTFFRKFIYGEHRFNSSIPGNIEKLHHDYAVTNFHVSQKYSLTPETIHFIDLSGEPINELAEFDVPELVSEVRQQFSPVTDTHTSVFTNAMAEELIERSSAFCLDELNHLMNGQPGLNSTAWSWEQPIF